MNLSTLTTASLLMLYQSVKIALEQDDHMPERRQFEIRENPEWRHWSDQIADVLTSRSVEFARIEW